MLLYIYPWMESESVGVGDGDVPEAGEQVDNPGVELHLVAVLQGDGERVVRRTVVVTSQPDSTELVWNYNW